MEFQHVLVIAEQEKIFFNQPKPVSNLLYQADISENLKDAIIRLSEARTPYCGIFIDERKMEEANLSGFKLLLEQSLGAPIYCLTESQEPLQHYTKSSSLFGFLNYPFTYTKMVQTLEPVLKKIQMERSLVQQQDHNLSPVHVEGYCPVLAAYYLAGQTSEFDLFIRLPSGRFLKILNQKDAFDPRLIESLIQKGVRTLYIKKIDQKDYLDFCVQLAARVSRHSQTQIPYFSKIEIQLNLGQEILSRLAIEGRLSRQTLLIGQEALEQLQTYIQEARWKNQAVVKLLLGRIEVFEHSTACSFLAMLLAQTLGIHSRPLVNQIGMAALLHDVGLIQIANDLRLDRIDEPLIEKIFPTLYRAHPSRGFDLLSQSLDGYESVLQAVLQHHERRDGKGFPSGLGTGNINMIAQIVGSADLFIRYLGQSSEFWEQLEPAYSYSIVQAWEKIIGPSN